MASELFSREDLLSEYRTRRSEYIFDTFPKEKVDSMIAAGWEVHRENKTSTRMRIFKPHGRYLEDRVWTLLYRMGFPILSGSGGLSLNPNGGGKGTAGSNQIDVVAIDTEAAIAVECKSLESPRRRTSFQEELGKFKLLQERFTRKARSIGEPEAKRLVAMVMVLHNAILNDADRQRAEDAKVIILDTQDLEYFEQLTAHLGAAARYQFLADLMADREVPGLSITVPAIRSKMGGETAYTFSISPEYLLKIAYVSHRAKGKASDVNAYQRMIKKSRLKAIRKYIDEESNIFPTNIVVSLDGKHNFDLAKKQDGTIDDLGWIRLRPTYKSAWIIDGQHRLFAYSGSRRAASSRLSVLAFENLDPSLQAQLFIDINAEQKAVKKDLLHELYAELHWNSDDTPSRIKAVITKAIQSMDQDPESPFYGRVIAAEGSRDSQRSLSLTNLFKALHQPELFMGYTRGGRAEKPGVLWASDNQSILNRTIYVINRWFAEITKFNRDWWNLGSAPGGGLAMNDSVSAMIMVLRSVADHLAGCGKDLYNLDDSDAVDELMPFAVIMAEYLAGFDVEDRARYRDLRGIQGQTTRMRRFQAQIRDNIREFSPAGLDKFIEEERAETNTQAREIVEELEMLIQKNVVSELKREYGEADNAWWTTGVPRPVRVAARRLEEEDDNARGGTEHYLNLIDYRRIIQANWILLEPLFALGPKNASKEKRTAWLQDLNDVRKVVAHASSGVKVSLEQLAQIDEYRDEIKTRLESAENM